MRPRILPSHCFMAAGVTALLLAFSSAGFAQLPDAPSPAWMQPSPAASQNAPATSANIPAPTALQQSSSSSAYPRQWALLDEAPIRGPQESLYKPGRRTTQASLSFLVAERHAVPGSAPALQNACPPNACSLAQTALCCGAAPSPFTQYLKSRDAFPLTARDNLNSAVRNVADPFNLLTIAADSVIGVVSDPDSAYGPGARGMAKYAGVSLTEDMTGEFFGTFLVPSLAHQDPHYHRVPFLPIKRRILHAIVQVVWARSYTGKPMFNYANIVGGIATAVVSNTFVPGPGRQGFGSTSRRLALAFAISPSGNLIEEFLPDIASRINLRVVIFQRILNSVSREEAGVP